MASIHSRQRKDGTTVYQLAWRDPDTGRQERETFEDKREAESWQRLLNSNGQSLNAAKRIHDNLNVGGPTVQEHLNDHADMLTGVDEYTVKRYRDAARLHFDGVFGSLKIASVTHEDIVKWIRHMEGRGYSPKTINNSHGLLSSAMQSAIRKGLRGDNPCKGVRLPKNRSEHDDAMFITRDDYKAIWENLDPHFRPFFDFLVGTGLRFSEATALRGGDFTLDGPTPLVRINKAHKLASEGGRFVGPTKTAKGRRTVSLAPSTVAAVRPLVEAAMNDGGPVFRMKRGGDFSAQAVYTKAWNPARTKAGVHGVNGKKVTIHSLRHLHAAILLEAGLSMYELSRRLGHGSIQMSVDLYSHLLPDAHFSQAAVAAKALEGF
jgi:integrase